MTARPGFPAVSGAATFQDIRKALAGQVVKSATGTLRKGVLPAGTGSLITGTATMVVNVATHVEVLDRNGAVFLPNDGVTPVTLSSAPASGSRWSVVYGKQRETEAPFSDSVNGPIIDKVESTTSETAARALLPAGALEIGVVKVDAGSTNTNAVGVTITDTVPYTAMEGGTVLLRNQGEQDAWAPHDGSYAHRLDTGVLLQRVGGVWKRPAGQLVAVRCRHATPIPLSSSTFWAVPFDTLIYEYGGDIWRSATNTRLYAPIAGVYQLSATVGFAGSFGGRIALRWRRNGVAIEHGGALTPAGVTEAAASASTEVFLAAGDYMEVLVFQDSGASQTLAATDYSGPTFTMSLVAEG